MFSIVLLVGAGFLAGALNAVAGGGTFLTLPALVFLGVPPIVANATSTATVLEQERPPTGERGSSIGALTGLLFYVTSRARTYTAEELSTFVEAAGFDRVRRRRSQRFPGHVVVVGRA